MLLKNIYLSLLFMLCFSISQAQDSIEMQANACDPCIEDQNILRNGSFSDLPGGELSSIGSDWISGIRTPGVTNNDGCVADGSVTLWGNAVIGESLQQTGLNIEAGKTYRLSFCGKFLAGVKPNEAPFVRFLFHASNAALTDNFGCTNIIPCENIGMSPMINSVEWATYCLDDWTATEDYDRITISIITDQSINNGDFVSFGRMDDICLIPVDECPIGDIQTDNDVSGLVQTQGGIFASGVLSPTKTTEFIAGGIIRLQPGFRATEGIYFRAKIGECRLDDIEALAEEDVFDLGLERRSEGLGQLQLNVAPNPFASSTNIRFYLPESSNATLSVHDISGRILTTIESGGQVQGWQNTTFYPEQLNAGVYYLILRTAQGTKSEKIVILK